MNIESYPNVFRLRFDPRSDVGWALFGLLVISLTAGTRTALAQYPSAPQITKDGTAVLLQNYASLPASSRTTSNYPPPINYANQLARANFLRSEPTNAPLSSSRFFVNDLNRDLYLLDKTNKTFTVYINFEEVFPKFDNNPGYAAGLVTFAFDPDYATNGIFYTVHTEDPAKSGSANPTNVALPGFNANGYTTTATVDPPAGTVVRQSVLVEWTDTNSNNGTFEGTARELLRVGFNSEIHPLGDLIFNPLAKSGDTDYRNLYISNGDGAAGQTPGGQHPTPQRLDALQGKILRITPDTNLRTNTSSLSGNGRYRIPTSGLDPNPFVSLGLTNVKKEIYAYGFRNPHRMSWDPVSNVLIVDDIGLNSWEEVNIIYKGINYGYAEREGIEQLFVSSDPSTDGKTGGQLGLPFPWNSDSLTVTGLASAVTPVYPVATYSHWDGDAISSGFVYRGSLMPQLRGKYIFGDITTGRLFYCDLADLIGNDDGTRTSLATIHELQVIFDSPYDDPDRGPVKRRMFDLVAEEYHHKGGTNANALPGGCGLVTGGKDPEGVLYGCGRADIRLSLGGDGELYVLSKSDGMIRQMVMAVSPPMIRSVTAANDTVTLAWQSLSNRSYRAQFKSSLADTNWTDLPGDVTAVGPSASKADMPVDASRFYRVVLLP